MKQRKLLSAILSIAMMGSLLAGCGGQPAPSNTSNPAGGPQPNQPGQPEDQLQYMVWNMGAEPKTWDPTLSSETISEYITISMFEGLTKQVQDGIEPGVAERWDVSDDGLTYTFHLRKSNWSDGTPLTAHDFEYTWKRMCDPAVASPSAAGVTDYVVGAAEYLAGTGTADGVMARALDDDTFEVGKTPRDLYLQRPLQAGRIPDRLPHSDGEK